MDKGLGQINSIHWPFFKKMGLDVVNDAIDNLEATAWLIEHHGMRDYKASEYCWKPLIEKASSHFALD